MKPTMLVLAAGASSRLGYPKALLVWKGRTLIEHAISRAEEAGFLPIVVLGSQAQQIRDALPPNALWVENPLWKEGLGSSIRCGADYAVRKHDPDLLGISLVDQPLVTSTHLRNLCDQLTDEYDCVATGYISGPGVPAVFAQRAMTNLSKLSGERGAKSLMDGTVLRVKRIEFSGTLDIDDAQDWEDFLEHYD